MKNLYWRQKANEKTGNYVGTECQIVLSPLVFNMEADENFKEA